MESNKHMGEFSKKNVWIIGASTGIGAALAKKLSENGATVILSARSEDKLKSLANEIEGKTHVFPFDVTERDTFITTAKKIKKEYGHIDSAILLAGMYDPTLIANINNDSAQKIINVNLMGAFNFIEAILPIIKFQKYGQIILTGSVAGYRGLPKGQPYSATKAAIINLAESLRAEEKEVDVRLICPGFVETPMTDKNDFEMPMVITPKQAANSIYKGMISNSFEIHFPKKFTLIMKCLKIMPNALYLWIGRKMMAGIEKREKNKG